MTDVIDPDRQLALNYAPANERARLAAVFALDETLGHLVATHREAMLGQIRLAWWREQLLSADEPASPIAQLLAPTDRHILSALADGWAILLDPLPLGEDQLRDYARLRGGTIFGIMGPDAVVSALGEGWALADFAYRCSDRETAERALVLAAEMLDPRALRSLSRAHLPFGILARLALGDVRDGLPRRHPLGSRRRAARALGYALFRQYLA
jgi:15-cis-phytoene synthase